MSNKEVLTVYHNKQNEPSGKVSYKWWKADNKAIHESVFPLVSAIQNFQTYRTTQNLKFARLYANMDMLGLTSGTYTKVGSLTTNFNSNRLTLNVVQSCIDTAAAKIAKNKPRPMFLTKQGDFSLKRKAKKLTQFLDGVFEQCDVYTKGQRVFVDSEVFGTGAMKWFIDPIDKEIKCERVFIEELVVDDVEGMYENPRQLHQKKLYSRDILINMFPQHEEAINGCVSSNTSASNSIADQIQVIESWHLPASKGSKDGKHAICCSGATLFEETWTKDYFPFVFFRWIPKLLGFFGQGLAEQLIGIQLEINKVLINIQAAQNLMCIPRIFVEESSKVNTAMISNEIGNILKYRGVKPTMEVGQGMPSETYSYLENLVKKAYEITGVSQLSAMQKKPAGLDSGAALREFQDIESERFMLTGMRYEKFYMDSAKIAIDLARDLYLMDNKFSVKSVAHKFMSTIKWKDVNLKDEEFQMQMFPVSLLPTTPAGKLQTVQDLVQAGFMSPDQAVQLLDFPDLDGFLARKTAAQDNIERILEKIIEQGEYTVPEKIMDLELAGEITKETILMSLNDGLDAHKVDLLRTFLDAVNTLQLANPPAEEPAEEAPPGAGAPPPAPVSDLQPYQG